MNDNHTIPHGPLSSASRHGVFSCRILPMALMMCTALAAIAQNDATGDLGSAPSANQPADKAGDAVVRSVLGSRVTLVLTPPPGTIVWGCEEYIAEGLDVADITGPSGVWASSIPKISWWNTGDAPVELGYTLLGNAGEYPLNGLANFDGEDFPISGESMIILTGEGEGEGAEGEGEDAEGEGEGAEGEGESAEGEGEGQGAEGEEGEGEDGTEEPRCCGGCRCDATPEEAAKRHLGNWLLIGLAALTLAALRQKHQA